LQSVFSFFVVTLDMTKRNIFITGGTGYLGQRLIPVLLERGYTVLALVRKGSENKLPVGCETVFGDALRKETFAHLVHPSDTFVQLVGTPRPSPAKAKEFREIDLPSVRASVAAASENEIKHFVYVSVAHPAPIMKDYIEVRMEGERLIRESGMNATIIRPWYILGPGHWWPYLLLPVYKVMEVIPSTRERATRLGLVKLNQMVAALFNAIDNPADGLRVLNVPDIRAAKI
jgi:uncharacterized protein YbjT (DUF2867 family)